MFGESQFAQGVQDRLFKLGLKELLHWPLAILTHHGIRVAKQHIKCFLRQGSLSTSIQSLILEKIMPNLWGNRTVRKLLVQVPSAVLAPPATGLP